jgi:uncharacterized ion transporter superfamily protein YfcC
MTARVRPFSFPSAYTVLLLVIVVCAALTWIVPAGRFDSLRYDATSRALIATRAGGEETFPAEQATLDRLGIRIRLDQFLNGSIRKPVSIPGTYHTVAPNRQGLLDILKAPVLGTIDAVEVVLFVLIIGGFIGVVDGSGAFAAGIAALVRRLRGRETWLIIIATAAISIGGTTIGFAEETFAFYPLLVPVFLAAGYDRLVPVAVIFTGTSIGTEFSTTNPFSTIIASHAAGIAWTSGLIGRSLAWAIATALSIAFIIRYAQRVRREPTCSLVAGVEVATPPAAENSLPIAGAPNSLSARSSLLLIVFGLTFAVMIYGVVRLQWWFLEMTTLFFVSSLVIGFIEWRGEKAFLSAFLGGANALLSVGLIIGLARGATIILERGEMSGTILQFASTHVAHMTSVPFIVSLLFVYVALGFFIQSSSGLAVLTMPIMSGLSDVAGVPREQIINAYMWGMGLISFLAPTGLLLPSLAMVDVRFDQWLRFIWPLVLMIVGLAALALVLGVIL